MQKVQNLYETLESRGYLYQYTNEESIKKLLEGDAPCTFYMGIDPTADSLHIGHFFALMMFRYLQEAGHKGILVIGGATALVGDPTGKKSMRNMLSFEQVEHNLNEVKKLVKNFIYTEGDNSAIILNNAEWINNYPYINFLRDIGTHFNINTMLNSEAYAKRLEEGGLTFLEMGYMLMQAYDFVYLNEKYGCVLQIGGSDQWGNIAAGVSLQRKLNVNTDFDTIYGLTCPLLTNKEGQKMGKTESGTLWVAREKTTSFDFYQYFYNIEDENVEKLLLLFTRIDIEEIKHLIENDILEAKRKMAYEITKLVHGEEEADKVLDTVKSLFGASADNSNAPTFDISKDFIGDSVDIISLLSETGFVESKSEARRLIQQGGISVDGNKVQDVNARIAPADIQNNEIMLKRGKKNFLKVIVSE